MACKFQIWKDCLGTGLYQKNSLKTKQLRRKYLSGKHPKLLLEFVASNWLEANQKYNRFMKFGPYRPMLQKDGTPDPSYFETLYDDVDVDDDNDY